MAIENNYDGPPSLKIYQEFVPTATSGGVDQNVVVVAEHFDVFKVDSAEDKDFQVYTSGIELPILWTALGNGSTDVDAESVKVMFKDAFVTQATITGATLIDTNVVKLPVDISDTSIPEGVSVGDIVSINGKTAYVIAIRHSINTTPVTVTEVPGFINTSNTASLAVSGNYRGSDDRIYYLKVVSVDNDKQVVVFDVTTFDGTDAGICELSADSTDMVANSGYSVSVAEWGFEVGDYYQIDAKASNIGDQNILHLDTNMGNVNDTVSIELGRKKTFYCPNTQYAINADGVVIGSDVVADIVFAGNAPKQTHVIYGKLFVEYRSRNNTYKGKIGYITYDNVTDVGYYGVENPLGAMVTVALKGGLGVYCTSVGANTLSEYRKAFSLLSKSTNTYGVVVGSLNEDVIAEVSTFVEQQANPDVANYKIAYYGLDDSQDINVFGSASGANVTVATVKDGILTMQNSSGAKGFKTSDVRAGDIVRINYSTDISGNSHYMSYTVDHVIDDNTLEITNYNLSVPVGKVFEIWRTLEGSELVEVLKSRVYTTNHRCYCVFGDGINIDGIEDAPAWLKAALPAGMRAGEYCQRPISNLQYDGCTAYNKLSLNAADLVDLASRGVWILANSADGSTVYNYHQLSTDMSDKKYQEQSYTTNFDNISKGARNLMLPYYGNSNISEEFLEHIYAVLSAFLSGKTTNAPRVEVGPQLISYSNFILEQDPVNRDRVYMSVDYMMPAPFNHIELRQRLI